MARTAIRDFALSNKIYVNATVTFYTVSNGARTTTKAPLYAGLTGSTLLANPQTLDSYGKLRQPVYIDQAVIGMVTGLGNTPDHETGIMTEGDSVNAAAASAAAAAASAAAAEAQREATVEIPSNTLIQATGGSFEASLADRFRNLYDPVDYGADPTGVADSTAAFQYCLDTFRVCMPRPGIYMVGDLEMVAGGAIIGMSGPTYSINTSNGNTILRRKNGCTALIDMSGKAGYNLQNIVFDGVNRNCFGVVGLTSDIQSGYISNCTFRYFSIGLGGINNGATYGPRGAKVMGCTFTENVVGVQSPIDTHFTDCVVAGNTSHGVNHTAGANDCMYSNCKIEWNQGAGLYIFNSSNVIVTGGIVDRNYRSGIHITDSSFITVTGVMLRRNGRNATFGQDCHIALEGSSASNIVICGNNTRTGADDNGGGPNTPARFITIITGTPTFSVIGNFGGGCTNSINSAPIGPSLPASSYYRIEGNAGVYDATRGLSMNRASGSFSIDNQSANSIASGGGTATITLTRIVPLGTFSTLTGKLRVNSRQDGSLNRNAAEVMFVVGRDSGSASLRAASILSQIGNNSNFFSLTPDTLAFTAQTTNFTVGQVVTGATSGATGTISAQTDAGTTGTLTLTGITGTFQNGETITDPLGGSATANGRDYYAGGVLLQFTLSSTDATTFSVEVVNRSAAQQHINVRMEQ